MVVEFVIGGMVGVKVLYKVFDECYVGVICVFDGVKDVDVFVVCWKDVFVSGDIF